MGVKDDDKPKSVGKIGIYGSAFNGKSNLMTMTMVLINEQDMFDESDYQLLTKYIMETAIPEYMKLRTENKNELERKGATLQ